MVALVLIALTDPSAAQAQGTRTLQGAVRDSISGERLPNATVVVQEHGIGTLTNFDGRFTLLNVPPEPFTLRVQALEYAAIELSVEAAMESPPVLLRRRKRERGDAHG